MSESAPSRGSSARQTDAEADGVERVEYDVDRLMAKVTARGRALRDERDSLKIAAETAKGREHAKEAAFRKLGGSAFAKAEAARNRAKRERKAAEADKSRNRNPLRKRRLSKRLERAREAEERAGRRLAEIRQGLMGRPDWKSALQEALKEHDKDKLQAKARKRQKALQALRPVHDALDAHRKAGHRIVLIPAHLRPEHPQDSEEVAAVIRAETETAELQGGTGTNEVALAPEEQASESAGADGCLPISIEQLVADPENRPSVGGAHSGADVSCGESPSHTRPLDAWLAEAETHERSTPARLAGARLNGTTLLPCAPDRVPPELSAAGKRGAYGCVEVGVEKAWESGADAFLPLAARKRSPIVEPDVAPVTSIGSSLWPLLTDRCLERMRRRVADGFTGACEVCGTTAGNQPPSELWTFRDPVDETKAGVQQLVGHAELCASCDETLRLGEAEKEHRLAAAADRLAAMNGWPKERKEAFLERRARQAERRAGFVWALDASVLGDGEPLEFHPEWRDAADGALVKDRADGGALVTFPMGVQWMVQGGEVRSGLDPAEGYRDVVG